MHNQLLTFQQQPSFGVFNSIVSSFPITPSSSSPAVSATATTLRSSPQRDARPSAMIMMDRKLRGSMKSDNTNNNNNNNNNPASRFHPYTASPLQQQDQKQMHPTRSQLHQSKSWPGAAARGLSPSSNCSSSKSMVSAQHVRVVHHIIKLVMVVLNQIAWDMDTSLQQAPTPTSPPKLSMATNEPSGGELVDEPMSPIDYDEADHGKMINHCGNNNINSTTSVSSTSAAALSATRRGSSATATPPASPFVINPESNNGNNNNHGSGPFIRHCGDKSAPTSDLLPTATTTASVDNLQQLGSPTSPAIIPSATTTITSSSPTISTSSSSPAAVAATSLHPSLISFFPQIRMLTLFMISTQSRHDKAWEDKWSKSSSAGSASASSIYSVSSASASSTATLQNPPSSVSSNTSTTSTDTTQQHHQHHQNQQHQQIHAHHLLHALRLTTRMATTQKSHPNPHSHTHTLQTPLDLFLAGCLLSEAQLCDAQTGTQAWAHLLNACTARASHTYASALQTLQGLPDKVVEMQQMQTPVYFTAAEIGRIKRRGLMACEYRTFVGVEEYAEWLHVVREVRYR